MYVYIYVYVRIYVCVRIYMYTYTYTYIYDTCVCVLSHVWHFFCSPKDYRLPVPLSTGFSRQEYWSGLPFPTLGDLPNPGTEPESLVPPALAGGFFTTVPLNELPFSNSYSQLWAN